MTWADKVPMPDAPVWHYHIPRKCSCNDGLTPDENWSEMEDGPRADPPFPGEGWLVCGFCDGDGWDWHRAYSDDLIITAAVNDLIARAEAVAEHHDLALAEDAYPDGINPDVITALDALGRAVALIRSTQEASR